MKYYSALERKEAGAPILWPPDAKSLLIRKDPDVRKDWRQKEKRTTEDDMVGWHHDSMDMNLGKPGQTWEMVRAREAWSAAVHEVTKSQIRLSNWTTTIHIYIISLHLVISLKYFPHQCFLVFSIWIIQVFVKFLSINILLFLVPLYIVF